MKLIIKFINVHVLSIYPIVTVCSLTVGGAGLSLFLLNSLAKVIENMTTESYFKFILVLQERLLIEIVPKL